MFLLEQTHQLLTQQSGSCHRLKGLHQNLYERSILTMGWCQVQCSKFLTVSSSKWVMRIATFQHRFVKTFLIQSFCTMAFHCKQIFWLDIESVTVPPFTEFLEIYICNAQFLKNLCSIPIDCLLVCWLICPFYCQTDIF